MQAVWVKGLKGAEKESRIKEVMGYRNAFDELKEVEKCHKALLALAQGSHGLASILPDEIVGGRPVHIGNGKPMESERL